jgi:protein ImuA
MVSARRDEDLFWAMEEGLRTPGIAAVVGETRAADPTAGRRLSLASGEESACQRCLAALPSQAPAQSVCATRWRVLLRPSYVFRAVSDFSSSAGGRAAAQPLRHAVGRRDAFLAAEWNDETRGLAVVPQAQARIDWRASTPKGLVG